MKTNKLWGKLLAGVLSLGLLVGGMSSNMMTLQAEAADNTQTVSAQMPFRQMTVEEIVGEMGTGWNLGNTMDGHTGFTPNETLWQNVETTQELIKAVHDMGFNTIRIPVTWGTMIDDENGYAIDETWMSRVQDIVDYAMNMNMYAIINIHHDGAEQSGWLRIAAEDLDPVKEKYEAVWKQIAERFKDYDEHLIFESMNEVCGEGTTVEQDTAIIMEFNQIFVDTVRATGSNNAERWLSVPGRYTNITNTTKAKNGFALPNDTVKDRIFVSVHYYDWQFGMLETMQTTEFIYGKVELLIDEFKQLYDTFTSKGIPVILGEYGAINKMNTVERAYHLEAVNRICQLMDVVPVYWDQGWYDLSMSPDYSFTLVDREACEAIYPEIIAGIMRGSFFEGSADCSDIVQGVTVTPLTDLGSASEASLSMQIGDVKDISLSVDKYSSNDVVLWKSSDESVATVNADGSDLSKWCANVHATGIGNAVITAYAQSGSAILEIPVEVKAANLSNPCTAISVEAESYTLTEGKSIFLNATMAPADTDAYLTYRSSDTDVITVSKVGKVVATGVGSAYVIITSSDGKTLTVPVTVEAAEVKAEIALALNVYYNDSELSYYTNECGSAISVSEDGTYTLSFDCATDLSSKAKDAGVTGLNNLTAIYIKDDSVTKGLSKKSPLVSCDIIYNSVVVDGVSYTVNMDAPKSAIKASGIVDTNDPINAWDGSVINEVTVTDHVLNFSELPNPQKIEVTFTLSNLVFEEGAGAVEVAKAESLKVVGTNVVTVNNESSTTVSVTVSPAGSSKVMFVSSNAGIVSVDNTAVTPDSDGTATVTIYGHAEGKAVITAFTDNGIGTVWTVTVEAKEPEVVAEPEGNPEEAPATDEESVAEPGDTEKTPADQTTSGKTNSGFGTMQMILLIIGIVVLAVVVFVVVLKVASGPAPKKEEAVTEAVPEDAQEAAPEDVQEATPAESENKEE